MPSENPRVAAYISKQLKEKFNDWKAERGIKSESQALAIILGEFLGVGHQVTQEVDYSAFATREQLMELVSKVSDLSATVENMKPGELLKKLLGQCNQLEERVVALEITTRELEVQQSSQGIDKTPEAQMPLLELPEPSEPQSEPLNSESESSEDLLKGGLNGELQPMSASELARRFGVSPQAIANNKSRWKDEPDTFTEWTRRKDPDGVAWRFSSEGRLYHPTK